MNDKLVLTGLSKRYGDCFAVDDFNLQVQEGAFVSLLGPSGSGKSTVLNMIAGLTKPSAGRILIDGVDLTGQPANARNIGLVFQSYALFPHLSARDNIAFPLEVRGLAPETAAGRVDDVLRLVKLDGLADRLPSELSGGQQQRVALARAIVFEPSLLLLDEPLGALDRQLRETLRQELRALQRAIGITTIMVTHDQEEALSMSDYIVVMAKGRAEQSASPSDLYLRPRNRFVAEFMGCANVIAGESVRRNGMPHLRVGDIAVPHGEEGVEDGCRLSFALRPEAVAFVAGNGSGGLLGTVAGIEYCGEYHRVRVDAHGFGMITSHLRTAAPPALGDTGALLWSPRDMHLLAQDDGKPR
ncbi:MAG: ABC transporter ATP-binding protein [Parvibaculaceae bacterium]